MAKKITVNGITLSWHKQNGQWRKSIGFKPDKTGTRRVPADWYLGDVAGVAAASAAERIRQWRVMDEDWESYRLAARAAYPEMDDSAPFWFEKRVVEAAQRADEVQVGVGVEMTLAKAVLAFLDAQHKRIKLIGPRKLKPYSYQTTSYNTHLALAPIPGDTDIRAITHQDLQGLVDHHYRVGGLSERTANNYCRAVWRFLRWLDSQPDIDFTMPKGVAEIFAGLKKPQADPSIPAMADIRKIMHATDGPMRAWCLLALNCGCYEVDLAALTRAAVVVQKRERCLWWRREKTSHQNTFHTLHWLFPETLAALDKYAEKDGELLLRHTDGKPLQVNTATTRRKIVSNKFVKLKKAAGYGYSFKSFRKFTADWLLNHSRRDGERMARLYLGQALGGSLRHYARDEFGVLTVELKRLHHALVKAKALPPS